MAQNDEFRSNVIAPVECIQAGWELIRRDLILYVGMGIVVVIGSGIVPILLQGPLTCGLFMCFAESARGGKPSFELLFKGFDKFVPCLIVALVQVVAAIVVMIPVIFLLFGVFVMGASGSGGEPSALFFVGLMGSYGVIIILSIAVQALFLFAYPILAERDIDGLEAVKASMAAVRGNLSGVLILILLNVVVAIVAWMLCCLPILVVIPLMHASYFAAYQRITTGGDISKTFE